MNGYYNMTSCQELCPPVHYRLLMLITVVFFSLDGWSSDAIPSKTTTANKPGLIQHIRHRLEQIWFEGHPDLYITGLAWHNRYFYTQENIQKKHYNEFAAGGGLGKSFIDEDGDWHALYAMGFSDSHQNFQPLAGYGFLKMFYFPHRFNAGAGFTWFVTERKDIFHGIPFVGIPLPMVSVGADRLSIYATYVPGGRNIGNVLFVFAKWAL